MDPTDRPNPTAAELVKRYGLRPHPEGGHYREVHRSKASVGVPAGYPGERVALTAIYFLLSAGEFSALHREWVRHLVGDFYYRHFANKEDILAATIDSIATSIEANFARSFRTGTAPAELCRRPPSRS